MAKTKTLINLKAGLSSDELAALYVDLLDKHNALVAKLDTNTAIYNDLSDKFNLLLAKLDTDFTAQNIAVTSSQLDEDYTSTLEVDDASLDAAYEANFKVND